MKIAVVGAGGWIGGVVTREALARGHEVTAIVRDRSRVELPDAASAVTGDASDPASIAAAVTGHDAVVSAVSRRRDNDHPALPRMAQSLLDTLPAAGVNRLVWVGGAGSLEFAPGQQIVDSADFPEEYRPEARAQRDALNVFRSSNSDVAWGYFSPAAVIEPGERTSRARTEATDQLLTNSAGESQVSVEDYASALLDELERPQYVHERFTIATM